MSEEFKRNVIKMVTNDFNEIMERGLSIDEDKCSYEVGNFSNNGYIKLDLIFKPKEEEDNYVECPMEFESFPLGGKLGLKFGNNQTLFYGVGHSWAVGRFDDTIKTKICKTPTPKDKLEVGKWYLCSMGNIEKARVINREFYHMYLGNGKYVYIEDENICTSEQDRGSWYEVVKDEH